MRSKDIPNKTFCYCYIPMKTKIFLLKQWIGRQVKIRTLLTEGPLELTNSTLIGCLAGVDLAKSCFILQRFSFSKTALWSALPRKCWGRNSLSIPGHSFFCISSFSKCGTESYRCLAIAKIRSILNWRWAVTCLSYSPGWA